MENFSILESIIAPLIVSAIVSTVSIFFNRNYIKKHAIELYMSNGVPQIYLFTVIKNNYKERIDDIIHKRFKNVVFYHIKIIGGDHENEMPTVKLEVKKIDDIYAHNYDDKYHFLVIRCKNQNNDLIFKGINCRRQSLENETSNSWILSNEVRCYIFAAGDQVETLNFQTDFLDLKCSVEGKNGLLSPQIKSRSN
jgi:hypothetical protein